MLLVSYDISNDKLRTQFSKLLERHGRRLQYSVFEIKHTKKMIDYLLLIIEKKFSKAFDITDSIIIYPVCEACTKKVIRYGFAVHEEQDIVFL
jgi:CRISPR-associated endonuclease Cas2